MAVTDRSSVPEGWPEGVRPGGTEACPGIPDCEAKDKDSTPSRFEPTVGEHLRLGQFLRVIEQADERALRVMCGELARLALLVYPSTIRGLVWQSAEDLKNQMNGDQRSQDMAREVLQKLQSGGADS